MKRVRLFVLALACLLISCGSTTGTSSRYISSSQNVNRIQNAVVALVAPDRSEWAALGITPETRDASHEMDTVGRVHRPFCSGFFVAQNRIMTAAHCVERTHTVTVQVGSLSVPLRQDPIGDVRKIATYSQFVAGSETIRTYRLYRVIRYSRAQDIALLEIAPGETPHANHTILHLGAVPVDGQQVYALGHPVGQAWTLTAGIVSHSMRTIRRGHHITQASSQVYFGNSGGPLIDNRGNAIGVASRIIRPYLAFFTHVTEMRELLRG